MVGPVRAVIGALHHEPHGGQLAYELGLKALEGAHIVVATTDSALIRHDRQAIAGSRELSQPRNHARQELVVIQPVHVAGVAHERAVPIEEDEASHPRPVSSGPRPDRKRGVTPARQWGTIRRTDSPGSTGCRGQSP